jgi:hypothetical protein
LINNYFLTSKFSRTVIPKIIKYIVGLAVVDMNNDLERSRDIDRGDKSDESPKSGYSCETCNQSFSSRQELKEHSSTQH